MAAGTLALFTAAIGCHNSNTPPQATSAASPTPTAQAQKPAPTPTPSAQAEAVPAVPIQVKPPASFTSDQLPQNQPLLFAIQGNAGQFLHAKINPGKWGYAISVQPPASDSDPLEVLPHSGDCSGSFVYALATTGQYQVKLAPMEHAASIAFSLLGNDDPMLNPGLTPQQISIDFGSFAQREQIATIPFSIACEEGDETWPTHLGLDNGHFEIHVMQVAALKSVFATDKGEAQALTNLQAALTSGKIVAGQGLEYTYKDRWGAYLMSARPEIIKGEGWRGLRWIGGYGGDEEYPSEGLGYLFEGISDDGRYFILVRADISHPDQKRLRPPRQINGTPPKTWESPGPHGKEARLQLEKALAVADPASFQPSLDQLDAVIRSLRLKN